MSEKITDKGENWRCQRKLQIRENYRKFDMSEKINSAS